MSTTFTLIGISAIAVSLLGYYFQKYGPPPPPKIAGIDLGTTYSSIAVFLPASGQTIVIEDKLGKKSIPSVVGFLGNGEIVVGTKAVEQQETNPSNTIYDAKRFIGKRFEENDPQFQMDRNRYPFTIKLDSEGFALFEIEEKGVKRLIRPEEIGSIIISYLQKMVLEFYGANIKEVVISVPTEFDQMQRTYTNKTVDLAGMNVRRIISEPTAAALAYGLHEKKGGGTMDVSVLWLNNAVFVTQAMAGNNRLGVPNYGVFPELAVVIGVAIQAGVVINGWPLQYCQINNCNQRKKRILTSDLSRRWKKFPIPFIIQKDVNRQAILEGIENWERTTCITFEEKEELPSDSSGLNFVFGEGCFSNVGMVKGRNQRIGIGKNCDNPFVVSHEIAHALGFFHEQSRWDRDDFVEIQFNNILPGFLNQFLKFSSSLTTTFGIKYDLGSVMHYDAFGYAKEGMATILTKDVNYQETIGQRFRLSFDDVKKMNFAYCNASCPFQLPCLHSGYTDPKNCSKCRCPDGLTGLLCSKVARTKTLCGDQLIFESEEEYKKLQFKGVGECNYLIKAPRDSRICLSMDVIHFRDHCQQNSFLEIHYQTSLGRTGAL
uniref:Metalloendopeptidase n=1 Tax=Meloidogyne javanica TaxID=6303 RepID=A0A915M800_MELJA